MTVVSLYVSVNWVKSMRSGHIYHNFSCCDDLSRYGKEYLNSLKCEFCTFFSIKFRKFWHTARLSRTNRHKVIKSENSPVFWPTCTFIGLLIHFAFHIDGGHAFSSSVKSGPRVFEYCLFHSPYFTRFPSPGLQRPTTDHWQSDAVRRPGDVPL